MINFGSYITYQNFEMNYIFQYIYIYTYVLYLIFYIVNIQFNIVYEISNNIDSISTVTVHYMCVKTIAHTCIFLEVTMETAKLSKQRRYCTKS